MEYGDSREALFIEPNAYIQNFSRDKSGVKKVVFSEPYESVPNYYMNNNFHKRDSVHQDTKKQNNCPNQTQNLMFDFKNLLPMLGGLLGKGFDLNSVASVLNNNQIENSSDGGMIGNIMKILSSDVGKNLLGILGKNNIKNSKKNNKKIQKIKSNDFCIDNYEKVE